jgi:hypothetical protein
MGVSGSIRQTERKPGRSAVGRNEASRKATIRKIAGRKTSFPFALQERTVPPSPGVHTTGLGSFFVVAPPRMFCRVPKPLPAPHFLSSYLIPLERKFCLGAARSNFHEQGFAIRRDDVHRVQAM